MGPRVRGDDIEGLRSSRKLARSPQRRRRLKPGDDNFKNRMLPGLFEIGICVRMRARCTLSPCGRGWLASSDARRVRGSLPGCRPLIRRRGVYHRAALRADPLARHLLPQGEKEEESVASEGGCWHRWVWLPPVMCDSVF